MKWFRQGRMSLPGLDFQQRVFQYSYNSTIPLWFEPVEKERAPHEEEKHQRY